VIVLDSGQDLLKVFINAVGIRIFIQYISCKINNYTRSFTKHNNSNFYYNPQLNLDLY